MLWGAIERIVIVAEKPKPMISVAGIRGTLGGSLRPGDFLNFASAFFSTLETKSIVLGADTRPSRPMMRRIVEAAAMAAGVTIHDIGIVPTPTVGYMTKHLEAGGGVAITASHNPINWNALKFFSPEGTFLNQEQMAEVLHRYEKQDFEYVHVGQLGKIEDVVLPFHPHIRGVLKALDLRPIRRHGFKVAVDLCNGAGIDPIPELLTRLDCKTFSIFDSPERAFEREPEPLPQNLEMLCNAVVETQSEIGFAVDPDADRLALVDETGRAIGEERTLTLAARYVLQVNKEAGNEIKPLVANLSTTRALDDVAAEFGTHVERTRIGEANVVERILESGALIGGEGNGGVIFPAVHPGRDAMTGIALILGALAVSGKKLSELNAEVPDYAMVKTKVGIEGKDLKVILEKLKSEFSNAAGFDEQDGLKIRFPDRWVHVRPSGTEPILRVFAEAPDETTAQDLAKKAMDIVHP